MRLGKSLWVIALWASLVPDVLAQEPIGSEEQARAEFQLGANALRAEDFAEAKARLTLSLDMHRHPRTAYNLALALQRLGEVLAARETLRSLQAGDFGDLDEGTTSASETLLDSVRADIARAEVRVGGVDAALILVDEHEHARILSAGPALVVELDPGEHVIQALSEDRTQSSSERVHIERGETARVELQIHDLRVRTVPDPGPVRDETTDESERRSLARSPVLWIVVAGVLVGGVIAAVLLTRPNEPIEDDVFGVTTTLRRD